MVKGWGGFVGGYRFKSKWGQKFTYKKKRLGGWGASVYTGSILCTRNRIKIVNDMAFGYILFWNGYG